MRDIDNFCFAPVLVPTLNRYEHFVRLIESLRKCKYSERTELIIGLDYPPNKQYEEGYIRIKKYLQSGIEGFLDVHVIYHDNNMGPRGNVLSMMDYISEKHDRYILSEDDNVFAYSFLGYMNAMLEKYKGSDRVITISGFSYPVSWIDHIKKGYIIEQSFFSAWGYGTFLSTYRTIMEYYAKGIYLDDFYKKKCSSRLLRISKKNFCYYIDGVWKENLSQNDIGISLYQLCKDKYCVMPTKTLVKNEGWDGSGLNCSDDNELKEAFTDQKINNDDIDWFRIAFEDDIKWNVDNERIINKFFPAGYVLLIKSYVKNVLLKLGIKRGKY